MQYAYVAGAMYKGIASAELVTAMSRGGFLAFFGAGGLDPREVARCLAQLKSQLPTRQNYGVNLLCDLDEPAREDAMVELLLANGVQNIEASAFLQVTASLVWFRLAGLSRNDDGEIVASHRIIAKISRPEVAREFMNPAPRRMVENLVAAGRITREQAELSSQVPVATDLCVEADSGGHTDRGVALVLWPGIMRLRDEMMTTHRYARRIRVGAAGGIGTPEAAAAAFVMGADFILTGSVNQCTVESGAHAVVKDMLQEMEIQDTDYAPAGDMFEIGAQVQVLRKGVFFPARANRLHDLYRRHNSIEEIDEETRRQIAERIFRRSFDEVWTETKTFYARRYPRLLATAESNPKKKMALIFRWYFVHTSRLALQGNEEGKVDYQVHCGPSLGAFNQWVKGTRFEFWRDRHVHEIAEALMDGAAEWLNRRYAEMRSAATAEPVFAGE